MISVKENNQRGPWWWESCKPNVYTQLGGGVGPFVCYVDLFYFVLFLSEAESHYSVGAGLEHLQSSAAAPRLLGS